MSSAEWLDALQFLQPFVYGALCLAAVGHWQRHPGPTSAWLVATFGILGLVVVFSQFLPEDSDAAVVLWTRKVMIAILVLFPYCLFRFVSSLVRARTWIWVTATIGTLAISVTALFLPTFPTEGETRPGWFRFFILVLLVQWVALTGFVAAQLWRAGAGQPTVARRRMRTMSVGAAGLALALVVAGEPSGGEGAAVAVQLLALGAAPLMLIGFAPPYVLRAAWRRKEESALRETRLAMMAAATVSDVRKVLLPRARSLVGASAAILETGSGEIVASDGLDDDEARVLMASVGDPAALNGAGKELLVSVPMMSGHLTIVTNPLMPYFGVDEVGRLEELAALADLALARAELHEEAERANRAKSDFLSRMSHELRTPLNAVLGFAQLLEMDRITPQQRDATGEILKAGKHLLELIDEILDIARIEAGKLRLSMEPVDAVQAVEDCISLLTPLARRESVQLDLEGPGYPQRSVYVVADRQRLKQVLLNLISNGLKYNREEGRVEVSIDPPAGGRLKINVTDTGHGIPPERMERLFAPFERLGAEGSRIEGTGLGLALSKPLVEAMGGTLSVSSEMGSGTTFSIELASAENVDHPVYEGVIKDEPTAR